MSSGLLDKRLAGDRTLLPSFDVVELVERSKTLYYMRGFDFDLCKFEKKVAKITFYRILIRSGPFESVQLAFVSVRCELQHI